MNVRSPIAIVPVRADPVLGATVNVTVPLPRPMGADVMLIQPASAATVQSQKPCACTVIEPVPPVAGTF
jgi:hypothetical protein